uniref:Biotin/lipoyl-binding protein n=1 Tax=candidate division WOR-3 bacterium TaxID=2052148 RepID=A0A7C6A9Y9_UNCW3
MKFNIVVDGHPFLIEINKVNNNLLVTVDNESIELGYETNRDGSLSAIILGGKRYEVRCNNCKGNYKVSLWQKPFEVSFSRVAAESEPKLISDVTQIRHRVIKAPMSGLVIAIHTKQNQEVKPGDALILLEAMKMQNEIRSPIAAKIRHIYTAVGKTVEKGEKLLELEPL